jgi:hypothetical protein
MKNSNTSDSAKVTFFTASFGIVSVAMLGGVWGVLRKFDAKVATKTNVKPVLFAFQALAAGTALCLGTFATVGAFFVYTTGITSVEQFATEARKITAKLDIFPKPQYTDAEIQESAEFEKHVTDLVNSIWTDGESESSQNGGASSPNREASTNSTSSIWKDIFIQKRDSNDVDENGNKKDVFKLSRYIAEYWNDSVAQTKSSDGEKEKTP